MEAVVKQGSLAGLEAELARDVVQVKARDPFAPVIVVAGSILLRRYLGRRLAELAGPLAGVEILTVGELALRLGERSLLAAGRAPLPVLADRLLASEAARSEAGRDFGAVRLSPGFGEVLYRTLRELRRAGADPATLEVAAFASPEPEKVRALAGLAAQHAALRARHYVADDALAVADPARLGSGRLHVYGLAEVPALLRRILERVPALVVYLPDLSPAAGPSPVHAPLRTWLAGASTRSAAADPAPPTALAHVQATLFAETDPGPAPADETVHVSSAPDPAREVRAAVRRCLAWARDGIPFHEMAIAFRHPEPYRTLVEATLREAGVTAYVNDGSPLAELPLGRRTLALLDLLDGGFARRDVIAFALDAHLPAATRERYAGSAASWDKISREAGIVRGREQWEERLATYRARLVERAGDDPPPWLDDRLAAVEGLRAFVADLAELAAARPATATWTRHVAALEHALDRYVVDVAPIVTAVRDLAKLDTLTRAVAAERFDQAVRGVIAGLRDRDVVAGQAGAFRARGVNVLDVASLAHLRFGAVCVLGLAERSYPAPPREDPLLLDAERAALAAAGVDLPLRARGADPEPLGFALAVQAARQRLWVSFPRTDHTSTRPLLPSSFARAIARSLAGERIAAEALDRRADRWLERLPADRLGPLDPAQALSRGDHDRALLETDAAVATVVLSGGGGARPAGRAAWLARTRAEALTVFDGGLTPDVRELLAQHPKLAKPMPPSALERFAKCPLEFFLSRVLRLSAIEEPEEQQRLDPLEKGALVHTILERAMERFSPDDPPRPEAQARHLEELDAIAAEEFARVEERGLTGYAQLWRIDRRAIHADLRLWYQAEVEDRAGMDSAALEIAFGTRHEGDDERSTDAPLELSVGGASLRFGGRMDRLEWASRAGGPFRVIDYKTGGRRVKARRLFDGGRALQLPLYLHAAAELLLDRPVSAGEAQYFYVSRRQRFHRHRVTGEQITDAREDFDRLVGGFAAAIAAGSFPARPSSENCRWCDFNGLCPAVPEHEAQMARKRGDERVADLLELEAIP